MLYIHMERMWKENQDLRVRDKAVLRKARWVAGKCMQLTSCWQPSPPTFKVCNQPCYLSVNICFTSGVWCLKVSVAKVPCCHWCEIFMLGSWANSILMCCCAFMQLCWSFVWCSKTTGSLLVTAGGKWDCMTVLCFQVGSHQASKSWWLRYITKCSKMGG